MKKLVLVPLLLFCQALFAQNTNCTIKGKINKTIAYDRLYLVVGNETIDSAILLGTTFEFRPTKASGSIARIKSKIKFGNIPGLYMTRTEAFCYMAIGNIFICVNELDKNNPEFSFSIQGSTLANDYEEQLRRPLSQLSDSLSLLMEKLTAARKINADTLLIKRKIEANTKECYSTPRKYIDENPESLLCIVALEMMGNGDPTITNPTTENKMKELKKLFNSLSDKVKNSEIGINYLDKLNKMN